MIRIVASPLAPICALLGMLSTAPAAPVIIDTVPVGNPGNANDPSDGDRFTAGVQNYGSVSYVYNIGKYEVTLDQYTAFLNAVAKDDTYKLYYSLMTFDGNTAGIARSGSAHNYSYSVIGSGARPVTYVTWGDAARFANWLANGQPSGAQDLSTTEDGSYFLNGAMTVAALNAVTRKPGATWVIPTENEWYKAAYHQPAVQGGDADNYWDYPTRTNIRPDSDQPPGDPSIQTNVANFYRDDSDPFNGYNDGYAVNGSTIKSEEQNYLTDAGAYTSSPSYYGTYDQGGNVWEYNETRISSFRGVRGGSWTNVSDSLRSYYRRGARFQRPAR